MSDANKAVVRRFVEEYQTDHDAGVADELLADDFVDHSPFGPLSPDRDGVFALFGMLFAAFPDFRAEIHQQFAEGDTVITRKTFHGTHRGDFVGIPPSGTEVAFDVIDIVRVRDRKMVEHWNVVDALSLMTQLGAIPAPT
jgi:steroid delta-isomerase-like uncharacterized protein